MCHLIRLPNVKGSIFWRHYDVGAPPRGNLLSHVTVPLSIVLITLISDLLSLIKSSICPGAEIPIRRRFLQSPVFSLRPHDYFSLVSRFTTRLLSEHYSQVSALIRTASNNRKSQSVLDLNPNLVTANEASDSRHLRGCKGAQLKYPIRRDNY